MLDEGLRQDTRGSMAVLNMCATHPHGQYKPFRVHQYMALATLHPFVGVIAFYAPFSVVATL